MLAFSLDCSVGHALIDGAADGADRLARVLKRSGSASVGEDAEVSDTVQAVRQDVEQEAADELVDGDRGDAVARLALPRSPGLSVPEGDPLAVEGDDPAVGDGDPSVMGRLMSNTDLHDLPAWHGLLNMKHHRLRPIVVPGMINMGGCFGRSG